MDGPLTTDEQDEIVAYMNLVDPEHERIKIDNSGGGWMIVILRGGVMYAGLHPRTFLSVIREDPPGDDVLKRS